MRTAGASVREARSAVETTLRRLAETAIGRYAEALIEMRIVDRALALASKLFVAILPLSILSTALVSGRSFGEQLVIRFGLTGEGARAARALFASPAIVQSGVGVIGLVMLVSSVLSFGRALERVYLDSWGLPAARAAVKGRLVWLAGFCVFLVIVTPVHSLVASLGAPRFTQVVAAVLGGALFLWTPYVLMGRRVAWRRLLPTAAISGAAALLFGVGSAILMPGVVTQNATRYGYIGVAFSLVTWLFCLASLIVAAAVLGAQLERERERAAAEKAFIRTG